MFLGPENATVDVVAWDEIVVGCVLRSYELRYAIDASSKLLSTKSQNSIESTCWIFFEALNLPLWWKW